MRHTLDDLSRDVYDYPDDEIYDADGADYLSGEDGYVDLGWSTDRRWRPVVAIAGAVVATCAIATAVILNSGDTATTKATVSASTPKPRTVMTSPSGPSTTPPAPRATAAPTPQLPPETVTTLTPVPSAAPTRTPTAAPRPGLPPQAAPPQSVLSPRAVLYSVNGTKQLLDMVNIVYTDAQGFPQTELNVALPWSKVVVLNPGVQTQSVIATSIYSRLNCSVVDAQGQPVVVSTNNSMIATCTR
ncbi:MAG TPA: MmpS family transport accessory protein [Mycobacterium sp.]|nr:MmpS family transport accessory protein [Mycobacterium sp.]